MLLKELLKGYHLLKNKNLLKNSEHQLLVFSFLSHSSKAYIDHKTKNCLKIDIMVPYQS